MSLPGRYNFTHEAGDVLTAAREAALQRSHPCIGPGHILLALLQADHGSAAAIVRELRLDARAIEREIEAGIRLPALTTGGAADLPYTERGKQVLRLALAATDRFGHDYTGTGHLLLGVLALQPEESLLPAELRWRAEEARALIAVQRTPALAGESTAPRAPKVLRALLALLDGSRGRARGPKDDA